MIKPPTPKLLHHKCGPYDTPPNGFLDHLKKKEHNKYKQLWKFSKLLILSVIHITQ